MATPAAAPRGLGGTWHEVPFDAAGAAEDPPAIERLLDDARAATDLYVFAHGYNYDRRSARRLYAGFARRCARLSRDLGRHAPSACRPAFAGILWPSVAIGAEEDPERLVAALAPEIPRARVRRIAALAAASPARGGKTRELARLLASLSSSRDDEVRAPEEAPVWEDLAPADLLRLFAIRRMKDRAGRIGRDGVAPLLLRILGSSAARVHLVGHSFGAKVVLASLSAETPPLRPVESALLIQAAVSHLCFAEALPGTGLPGGHRGALARVRKPVFATFSANDFPLVRLYHLAFRRSEDLGEGLSAAAGPSSPFAALGGYGPRLSGETIVEIKDPPEPYEPGREGPGIVGLRATRVVRGHSDLTDPALPWALLWLASGGMAAPTFGRMVL